MFILPDGDLFNYSTLVLSSFFIIFGLTAYYNTLIVQAGCTKIAELSINPYNAEKAKFDPAFSFESIKYHCIVETAPQGKAFLAFYSILPTSQSPY